VHGVGKVNFASLHEKIKSLNFSTGILVVLILVPIFFLYSVAREQLSTKKKLTKILKKIFYKYIIYIFVSVGNNS